MKIEEVHSESKERGNEDYAKWARNICKGNDNGLGCIMCKDLEKQSFKLGERMIYLDSIDYGCVHSTGSTTYQFNFDVSLERNNKPAAMKSGQKTRHKEI